MGIAGGILWIRSTGRRVTGCVVSQADRQLQLTRSNVYNSKAVTYPFQDIVEAKVAKTVDEDDDEIYTTEVVLASGSLIRLPIPWHQKDLHYTVSDRINAHLKAASASMDP